MLWKIHSQRTSLIFSCLTFKELLEKSENLENTLKSDCLKKRNKSIFNLNSFKYSRKYNSNKL